jgi:hypothetical protein
MILRGKRRCNGTRSVCTCVKGVKNPSSIDIIRSVNEVLKDQIAAMHAFSQVLLSRRLHGTAYLLFLPISPENSHLQTIRGPKGQGSIEVVTPAYVFLSLDFDLNV